MIWERFSPKLTNIKMFMFRYLGVWNLKMLKWGEERELCWLNECFKLGMSMGQGRKGTSLSPQPCVFPVPIFDSCHESFLSTSWSLILVMHFYPCICSQRIRAVPIISLNVKIKNKIKSFLIFYQSSIALVFHIYLKKTQLFHIYRWFLLFSYEL